MENNQLDEHDKVFIGNLQVLSEQMHELSQNMAKSNSVSVDELNTMKNIYLKIGAFLYGLETNNTGKL